MVDLTKDSLEEETLTDILFCPLHKLYRINIDEFSERQQNQLLKFIEEPSKTVHIVLLATSEATLLPTVKNRASVAYFAPYTVDELKQITGIKNDFVYNFCTAPGMLVGISETSIPAMQTFCENIVKFASTASYANLLKNTMAINCKEDYTKFDFSLFMAMFEYIAFNNYIKNNNIIAFNIYNCINKYKKYLHSVSINH